MTYGITQEQLTQYINDIETLELKKQDIADFIREKYSDAKSQGYDVKTIREIVKLRKLDTGERTEQEELLHLYKEVLGMTA